MSVADATATASYPIKFQTEYLERLVRDTVTDLAASAYLTKSNADAIFDALNRGKGLPPGDALAKERRDILDEAPVAARFPKWFADRVCKVLGLVNECASPVVVGDRIDGDPDARTRSKDEEERPQENTKKVECEECGATFKDGRGLAQHMRKHKRDSQAADEAVDTLTSLQNSQSPPKKARRENERQTTPDFEQEDDEALWTAFVNYFDRDLTTAVEKCNRSRLPAVLLDHVRKETNREVVHEKKVRKWWLKQDQKTRVARFADPEDAEYEEIEPTQLDPEEDVLKTNFTDACVNLFDKTKAWENMDILYGSEYPISKPSRDFQFSWLCDGPEPTEEMLQYKFPEKDATTGFVFYPKHGAVSKGYRWMFLTSSIKQIADEAREYIDNGGDRDDASLACLCKRYDEFKLACPKKGFNKKTKGICENPCERCWPALLKWHSVYLDHRPTEDETFFEAASEIGFTQYTLLQDEDFPEDGPNDAKEALRIANETGKKRYNIDIAKYEALEAQSKFKVNDLVLVKLTRVAKDDEIDTIYWPIDVCGYADHMALNVHTTYGAPLSSGEKWTIECLGADRAQRVKQPVEKQVRYDGVDVYDVLAYDEKLIETTRDVMREIGSTQSKHFEKVMKEVSKYNN